MRTRFAPSPTGPLHLGHAYSAILADDMARKNGGEFLLRIEDIDQSRCRQHWEKQLYDDLKRLGLRWPNPVMRQSSRLLAYATAIERLNELGILYACACHRRDIKNAMSAPQEGVSQTGPDGLIYPGTCRHSKYPPKKNAAIRLDVTKPFDHLKINALDFTETGPDHMGRHRMSAIEFATTIGDFIVARRDMGTSYHLSVVVDDADQKISDVIRGEDLFEATFIHVLLQKLLNLPTPRYHHHRLIRDDSGKRLAKRDDARAISKYRADGKTPADIKAMIGITAP